MGKATLSGPRADDLARCGWTHGGLSLPGDEDDRQRFAALWDDLVPDAYLGSARCRRNRRYSRVLAHRDGTLEPLLGSAFFQSKAINRVFGDQSRVFEPLTDDAFRSPTLAAIVRGSAAFVNEVAGTRDWELGLHLIRVLAEPGQGSEPAPEGRHSDGHAYVSICLVGRHRCVGGESRLYRRGERAAEYSVTMTEPLEVLLLSDTTMEHSISEIRTADASGPGWRDTLIVDFDAVTDPAVLAGRTHRSLP